MNNNEILKKIRLFCEEYVEENPETVYKYAKNSLYVDIINVYYTMGVRESNIEKFYPVFFKEYFQRKESN